MLFICPVAKPADPQIKKTDRSGRRHAKDNIREQSKRLIQNGIALSFIFNIRNPKFQFKRFS